MPNFQQFCPRAKLFNFARRGKNFWFFNTKGKILSLFLCNDSRKLSYLVFGTLGQDINDGRQNSKTPTLGFLIPGICMKKNSQNQKKVNFLIKIFYSTLYFIQYACIPFTYFLLKHVFSVSSATTTPTNYKSICSCLWAISKQIPLLCTYVTL